MLDLMKVASVLDACADHIDAVETEKVSTINAERQSRIDALANKYAEATGDEMPDNIRQKLANSDKDVIALLNSMIEKQAGAVESLGRASSRDDNADPKTVKEAAAAADDRFLNWIMN